MYGKEAKEEIDDDNLMISNYTNSGKSLVTDDGYSLPNNLLKAMMLQKAQHHCYHFSSNIKMRKW